MSVRKTTEKNLGVDSFEWSVSVFSVPAEPVERLTDEALMEGSEEEDREESPAKKSGMRMDSDESSTDSSSSDQGSDDDGLEIDLTSRIQVEALDKRMKRKWIAVLDHGELEKCGFDLRLPTEKKMRLIQLALLGCREVSMSDVNQTLMLDEGEKGGDKDEKRDADAVEIIEGGNDSNPDGNKQPPNVGSQSSSSNASNCKIGTSSAANCTGVETSVFYAKRKDKKHDRYVKLKGKSTEYKKGRLLIVQITVSQFSLPRSLCLSEITQNPLDILTARFESLLTEHLQLQRFVEVALERNLPPRVICMFSGAVQDIPVSFALCDGTDGTPDLRDKFVRSRIIGSSAGVSGAGASATPAIEMEPPQSQNGEKDEDDCYGPSHSYAASSCSALPTVSSLHASGSSAAGSQSSSVVSCAAGVASSGELSALSASASASHLSAMGGPSPMMDASMSRSSPDIPSHWITQPPAYLSAPATSEPFRAHPSRRSVSFPSHYGFPVKSPPMSAGKPDKSDCKEMLTIHPDDSFDLMYIMKR